MRDELDKALVKDFPDLFAQRYMPMSTTCMCWGMEHGDGWEPLVREMCGRISLLLASELGARAEFSQIKEKYGTLRVYIDCWCSAKLNEKIEGVIDEIEERSAEVCEVCSATPAKLKARGGWYRTLCPQCEKTS